MQEHGCGNSIKIFSIVLDFLDIEHPVVSFFRVLKELLISSGRVYNMLGDEDAEAGYDKEGGEGNWLEARADSVFE